MKKFYLFLVLLLPFNTYAVDLGIVGAVYDISEKDILDEIEERAKKVNWKAMIDESAKNLKATIGRIDRALPKAADNATYIIDLTMSLENPIYTRDRNGKPQVLYPKGYKFNALDYTKISKTYVFFDATRPEEIAWFKANYANTVSAMPIITRGSALEFADEIKREVYLIDDELMRKFKLKATPTIVYQEKNMLRADEFYLEVPK